MARKEDLQPAIDNFFNSQEANTIGNANKETYLDNLGLGSSNQADSLENDNIDYGTEHYWERKTQKLHDKYLGQGHEEDEAWQLAYAEVDRLRDNEKYDGLGR